MTSFTSRYGSPAVEFGSARLWAYERHGCIVVTASGRIDARNLADVTAYAGRYITRGAAFVLDLSRVTESTAGAAALPRTLDEQCSAAGADWALVASAPVLRLLGDRAMPLIDSVAHAEHQFDSAVTARRRMLLPLLGRTA